MGMVSRLLPATQQEAYSPQGLQPLARDPSRILFESSKVKPVHEPEVSATRAASSSAAIPKAAGAAAKEALGVVPSNPGYQKIVELQNTFLKDDGRLVWQKFAKDRATYWVTVGLCIVGSAALFQQLYSMSFPQKKED